MLGLCNPVSRTAAAYSLTRQSCHCQRLPAGINQCGELHKTVQRSRAIGRRAKSTETGDENSGHINAGPHEGIFFLESNVISQPFEAYLTPCADVFPLRLNFILGLPFYKSEKSFVQLLNRYQKADIKGPVTLTEQAIPKTLPIKVLEILPRLREGGAFVKFSHDPHVQAPEVEKTFQQFLKENPVKPWFNPLLQVSTCLVHGKPWVEDLNRFPSSKLKVEFVPATPGQPAAELAQEPLYSLFRRYGKLVDIVPQPTDSKEVPRYAYLNFMRVRQAIMAKNCMHGYTVALDEGGGNTGTILKLGYEQRKKSHWFMSWLMSHPRIVIPAVAAVFAAITVAIFDPYVMTPFRLAHV